VKSIHRLEDNFNPGPFACVLGNELFDRAHDPSPSLVLPADRITPLLKGGPLLRSGKMDDNAGIVVSLAGNAVDIVVGTPPTVQFLQRTDDAKFLFRVYERFVLRIRDAVRPPVAGFRKRPTAA
jgi:Encapsulating protein for peroxidase